MKQISAVEWLQEQLKDGVKYNPLEKNGYSNAEQRLFEQAKEMEKQQIIDAHNQGYADGYRDNGNGSIDYYKETYGGNK